jgi:hypothetical protein
MLESFFSRLCKSYVWLGGGVNIKEAGTSTRSADKLTYEEIEANVKTIKWGEMDKNIELATERLRVFKWVEGGGIERDAKGAVRDC